MNPSTTTTTTRRRFPVPPSAAAAAALLSGLASPATGQERPPAGGSIDLARTALDAHYEHQRLISKEESDWQLAEEILESRIELVRAQIEDLRNRTTEQEEKTTEADVERLALSEELAELDALYELQQRRVADLERQVRKVIALAPDLPDLRSKIDPSIDRLPDPASAEEDINASVSERFLSVLAILKFTNEFHRNIALTNETRALDDGREVEVRTLYLGLGQAYFEGGREDDPVAGVGYPTADGWRWEERPGSTAQIRKLIDIYEGTEVADFVPVPVVMR